VFLYWASIVLILSFVILLEVYLFTEIFLELFDLSSPVSKGRLVNSSILRVVVGLLVAGSVPLSTYASYYLAILKLSPLLMTDLLLLPSTKF
jgi:uncharacterized metal-binding protein